MSKPEQDQIDAEFEKARWVSLKLPAMVTAEEVRFGRLVWRLGYLAGAAAERASVQAEIEGLAVERDHYQKAFAECNHRPGHAEQPEERE